MQPQWSPTPYVQWIPPLQTLQAAPRADVAIGGGRPIQFEYASLCWAGMSPDHLTNRLIHARAAYTAYDLKCQPITVPVRLVKKPATK
jgi:hypothetical protein